MIREPKIYSKYFVVKCDDHEVFTVVPTARMTVENTEGGRFKMVGVASPVHFVFLHETMESALEDAIDRNKRNAMFALKEAFRQESMLKKQQFKNRKELAELGGRIP